MLKKECRQYWVKKRKIRTSTDGISHLPPTPLKTKLSKQNKNEDIPGTTAKNKIN